MNKSKAKGDRFERKLIQIADQYGLDAYRNRMSRAPGKDEHWDIFVQGIRLECKKRKKGFEGIRKILAGSPDAVVVAADRAEPVVVITYKKFLELLCCLKNSLNDLSGQNEKRFSLQQLNSAIKK